MPGMWENIYGAGKYIPWCTKFSTRYGVGKYIEVLFVKVHMFWVIILLL
jgi:hypothetical protein